MASGVPVVATAAGGNLELIKDGYCGRLFPPGDVAALVRLLAAYILDPSLRQAHASAAREVAVQPGLDTMVNTSHLVFVRRERYDVASSIPYCLSSVRHPGSVGALGLW
jgi:hypothetical protein